MDEKSLAEMHSFLRGAMAIDNAIKFIPLRGIGLNGQGVTVGLLDSGVTLDYPTQKPISENLDFTKEGDSRQRILPHGTRMATLIHTIAPNAAIANLKVIPFRSTPNRQIVERAIDYCIDHYPVIRIINLSLWFEPTTCRQGRCSLCKKVDLAIDAGLVVVTAAGNRGKLGMTCPAFAEKVIRVGATWSEEIAEWWRDLSRWQKTWKKLTGEFGRVFGTSFSAAYVSGGIALLLSGIPQATPDDIVWAVTASAQRIDAPEQGQGAGMVQFYEAYKLLQQRVHQH
jgi:subtilisin family serine protease